MRLRALRLFQAELSKKLSQPLWCLDIPRAKAMSVISKLDPNLSVEELIKKALIGLAKF